jgi:Beta propeller domain
MEIASRSSLVLIGLAVSSFALGACSGGGAGAVQPNVGQIAAALRLVEYDSCGDALEQLKRAAADYLSAYGLGGVVAMDGDLVMAPGPVGEARSASALGAGDESVDAALPAHSTTNTHEAGVDEPDMVKTDGRRIVSVVDGVLRVVDAASKKLVGTLAFAGVQDGWWYPSQLLISGDHALILGQGNVDIARRGPVSGEDSMYAPSGSTLVLVDLSGTPKIVSELDLGGSFVDARQVGSTARVVLHSGPALTWTYPSDTASEADALRANRDILAGSTIEDWLPHYVRSEGGQHTEGRLVDCADVSHPRRYSGTSMLTVLTVDIAVGLQAEDSVAVVADGQTVYGTGSSLYIADDHRSLPVPIEMSTTVPAPVDATTEIHKFDVSGPAKPRYVASGEVDGWLLNQYSLSEHDGYLRVATTRDSVSGKATPRRLAPAALPTESRVTVLAEQGGQLTKVGSVGGLGKGEQIYAVRFIGPVGYVVTFRQVDPLYTLDLSDPRSPRVVGELKIPGYSSYLHPAGDGRLIGIGQDADADGRIRGSQVSLFDVEDPAAPTRLDMFGIRGWSDAEYDPHAFLYWPDQELLVIPVWWDDGRWAQAGPTDTKTVIGPAGGALVLRVDGESLAEVGSLTHVRSGEPFAYPGDPTIRRSLVIGDTLWTLSPSGALASNIDDLDEQAWVPFTS